MSSPLLLAALLTVSPARATEARLVASDSESFILVWKSVNALEEGLAHIQARAEVRAIVPLVACAPKPGTPVVESAEDLGDAVRAVTVTKGKWAGCRGVVEKEYLQRY